MLPKSDSLPAESIDRFALEIDVENKSYNIFERHIKCSSEALKVFHRCSDAILERDPELYNVWIDDHRFYSHSIIEVIENELNSLYNKCLQGHIRPLHGFRWLEGLLLVIGSYSKYLKELNNDERLDAVLNLFYAAWITFFIHNRYAILQLTLPMSQPDANNNSNSTAMEIDEKNKPVSLVHTTNVTTGQKSDGQISRHLEKHLPNFNRIVDEVIELGHQLTTKRLVNLDKLDELHQVWKNPSAMKKRHSSGNFSLIIPRITSDVDTASTSIDWKMVFFDEFIRYADRFYLVKKSSPNRRRTIGGERFSINKWSNPKVQYFLTKNLFKRTANHEYEHQIQQLYQ